MESDAKDKAVDKLSERGGGHRMVGRGMDGVCDNLLLVDVRGLFDVCLSAVVKQLCVLKSRPSLSRTQPNSINPTHTCA